MTSLLSCRRRTGSVAVLPCQGHRGASQFVGPPPARPPPDTTPPPADPFTAADDAAAAAAAAPATAAVVAFLFTCVTRASERQRRNSRQHRGLYYNTVRATKKRAAKETRSDAPEASGKLWRAYRSLVREIIRVHEKRDKEGKECYSDEFVRPSIESFIFFFRPRKIVLFCRLRRHVDKKKRKQIKTRNYTDKYVSII